MSQEDQIPGNQNDAQILADRFRVVPERRLPAFDSRCAEAFEVQDLKAPHQSHFALVCRQDLPPRTEMLEAAAAISADGLVKPLSWGPLPWPPVSGTQRFVIVFAQPRGGRLLVKGTEPVPVMRPETVTATVIRPLAPLLRELSARPLVHGAIRAENLFFRDAEHEAVILGECLTAPPGMMQDVVYSTIEEGMADPSGRRRGGPEDDLYALGVLLVVLLNGGNPCADMSDGEIIAAKLKYGSYSSLLARAENSLGLNTVLRGLLCDDPEERWSARDLEYWIDGRQLNPTPPKRPYRASRPITFGGEEYFNGRSLAHALADRWSDALRLVKDGKLAEWVRHELGRRGKGDLISATLQATGKEVSGGPEEDDLALARVLIELDPRAPVRLRDFRVHVLSLGRALALDYHRPDRVEMLRKVMQGRLPQAWFEAQSTVDSDLISARKSLEQAETFLERPGLGMGFTRCLYFWNPGWPCQSPLLRHEYIGELRALLPALERYAQRGQPSGDPVDSHIAAFCASQMKQIPDRVLANLSNSDPVAKHLSMLLLLAEVQRQAGPSRLPALAAWFAARLSPLIETFHNRNFRRQVASEVERVAGDGSLGDLCWLFDNDALRNADEHGFLQSKLQYHRIVQEIAWLENGGLTARAKVLRASRQAASFVSAATSGVLLLILTVVYLF